MPEAIKTLEELCLDTAEMACRFLERTEQQSSRMALIDFMPLTGGLWIARAITVGDDCAIPVYVPDESAPQRTMHEAVVVLNNWLTLALASPSWKIPPQA